MTRSNSRRRPALRARWASFLFLTSLTRCLSQQTPWSENARIMHDLLNSEGGPRHRLTPRRTRKEGTKRSEVRELRKDPWREVEEASEKEKDRRSDETVGQSGKKHDGPSTEEESKNERGDSDAENHSSLTKKEKKKLTMEKKTHDDDRDESKKIDKENAKGIPSASKEKPWSELSKKEKKEAMHSNGKQSPPQESEYGAIETEEKEAIQETGGRDWAADDDGYIDDDMCICEDDDDDRRILEEQGGYEDDPLNDTEDNSIYSSLRNMFDRIGARPSDEMEHGSMKALTEMDPSHHKGTSGRRGPRGPRGSKRSWSGGRKWGKKAGGKSSKNGGKKTKSSSKSGKGLKHETWSKSAKVSRPCKCYPVKRPSRRPTSKSTRRPHHQSVPKPTTRRPTHKPSRTGRPTNRPIVSSKPSKRPASKPSKRPHHPSVPKPTPRRPTNKPSRTERPTNRPIVSSKPSKRPASKPSKRPHHPSVPKPTPRRPTNKPSRTQRPTDRPIVSSKSSKRPASKPTQRPHHPLVPKPTPRRPTNKPSRTERPTNRPTDSTAFPTRRPSLQPSRLPTNVPTVSPVTRQPTKNPTIAPTRSPSRRPTTVPTRRPTTSPTRNPTKSPSRQPTNNPTVSPAFPTRRPSPQPSNLPTNVPTVSPVTSQPTKNSTLTPTVPLLSPSRRPTPVSPTRNPTKSPSRKPTNSPTVSPAKPSTPNPTALAPTRVPSKLPNPVPTKAPTPVIFIKVPFTNGTAVNLDRNVSYQLQLDSKATPFNFIWVPLSNLGLVVKVDTDTGRILGTYLTSPASQGWGDPSRTAVDSDGSVWVANRKNIYDRHGSIVHIGLLENNQCEDRNGIPGIQTSTSNSSLDWVNATGLRGIDTAEDECIIHYTKVNSTGTRHLSVDLNNDLWVSGYDNRAWDLVKGGRYNTTLSGTILRSEKGWNGYGGYGGLIDKKGIIWSARGFLRWDPSTTPGTVLNQSNHDSYGLCIDSKGNVWNTALGGNKIRKFDPDGQLIDTYEHGAGRAQGCVVDKNDDVWVAHSNLGDTIGHLSSNGTWLTNVDVGDGPTGVAVDGNGKIWSTNLGSNTLSRINPKNQTVDMTVELLPDSRPYTYGDMTGHNIISQPNTGTWNFKYTGMWKNLQWTTDVPSGSSLVVQARNTNTGGWVVAENGVDLPLDSKTGYLEVQVIFTRASTGKSPILFEMSIIIPVT